jgi:hypothetical protein
MGKGSEKPAAPNYSALAMQDQAAKQQSYDKALQANRPNQVGPTGSLTWSQDPAGNWTQTTTMNPQEQAIMEAGQGNQLGVQGKIGEQVTGFDTNQINLGGAPAMPNQSDFSSLGAMPGQSDYSSLGNMPEVGGYDQRSIDTIRALQAPQLQRQRATKEAQLAAMGVGTGSGQAWNTEQQNLGDTENRADLNAILSGIQQGNTMFGQGMQARQQGASELDRQFAQAMQGRQQGATELGTTFGQGMQLHQTGTGDILSQEQANLGKLSGLMGLGRNAQMPTFPGVNQVGMVPTANMMGAAQSQYDDEANRYNADQASQSALLNTIIGAAGTAFGGPVGGAAAGGLMNYFNKPKTAAVSPGWYNDAEYSV